MSHRIDLYDHEDTKREQQTRPTSSDYYQRLTTNYATSANTVRPDKQQETAFLEAIFLGQLTLICNDANKVSMTFKEGPENIKNILAYIEKTGQLIGQINKSFWFENGIQLNLSHASVTFKFDKPEIFITKMRTLQNQIKEINAYIIEVEEKIRAYQRDPRSDLNLQVSKFKKLLEDAIKIRYEGHERTPNSQQFISKLVIELLKSISGCTSTLKEQNLNEIKDLIAFVTEYIKGSEKKADREKLIFEFVSVLFLLSEDLDYKLYVLKDEDLASYTDLTAMFKNLYVERHKQITGSQYQLEGSLLTRFISNINSSTDAKDLNQYMFELFAWPLEGIKEKSDLMQKIIEDALVIYMEETKSIAEKVDEIKKLIEPLDKFDQVIEKILALEPKYSYEEDVFKKLKFEAREAYENYTKETSLSLIEEFNKKFENINSLINKRNTSIEKVNEICASENFDSSNASFAYGFWEKAVDKFSHLIIEPLFKPDANFNSKVDDMETEFVALSNIYDLAEKLSRILKTDDESNYKNRLLQSIEKEFTTFANQDDTTSFTDFFDIWKDISFHDLNGLLDSLNNIYILTKDDFTSRGIKVLQQEALECVKEVDLNFSEKREKLDKKIHNFLDQVKVLSNLEKLNVPDYAENFVQKLKAQIEKVFSQNEYEQYRNEISSTISYTQSVFGSINSLVQTNLTQTYTWCFEADENTFKVNIKARINNKFKEIFEEAEKSQNISGMLLSLRKLDELEPQLKIEELNALSDTVEKIGELTFTYDKEKSAIAMLQNKITHFEKNGNFDIRGMKDSLMLELEAFANFQNALKIIDSLLGQENSTKERRKCLDEIKKSLLDNLNTCVTIKIGYENKCKVNFENLLKLDGSINEILSHPNHNEIEFYAQELKTLQAEALKKYTSQPNQYEEAAAQLQNSYQLFKKKYSDEQINKIKNIQENIEKKYVKDPNNPISDEIRKRILDEYKGELRAENISAIQRKISLFEKLEGKVEVWVETIGILCEDIVAADSSTVDDLNKKRSLTFLSHLKQCYLTLDKEERNTACTNMDNFLGFDRYAQKVLKKLALYTGTNQKHRQIIEELKAFVDAKYKENFESDSFDKLKIKVKESMVQVNRDHFSGVKNFFRVTESRLAKVLNDLADPKVFKI